MGLSVLHPLVIQNGSYLLSAWEWAAPATASLSSERSSALYLLGIWSACAHSA